MWSGRLSPLARTALAGEGVWVRARIVVGGDTADGEADFEQVLTSGEPHALGINVAGSDLACLMYTSGTTGRPKGAMLTHDNLLWHVINVLSEERGLRQTDSTVTVAPMFHIGGLGVHTLPLLYLGGTSAILPSFDPEQTLATMAREPNIPNKEYWVSRWHWVEKYLESQNARVHAASRGCITQNSPPQRG